MNTLLRAAPAAALAFFLSSGAAAQPETPKPPLPDEIRAVVVDVAPPPMREERPRTGPPGPRYVWTRGYWDWTGDSWRWIEGRWAVAPVRGATWIPARYVRIDGGWRYVPSHWSSQRVVGASEKAGGKGPVKRKGKGDEQRD